MKFKTQKRRLLALMDAYCDRSGRTDVSTKEVNQWAFAAGLWPVPARGDRDAVCEDWESRLEKAKVRK